MPSPDTVRVTVRISLDAAARWEAQGNAHQALLLYGDALKGSVSLAVTEHDELRSVRDACTQADVRSLLRRFVELTDALLERVRAGETPGAALGGNWSYLVFGQAAWLLGDIESGDRLVRIAAVPELPLSTKFWREYGRAMLALVGGQPYTPADLKLKGVEQHWAPYLALVADLSHQRDHSASLAAVRTAFAQRNRDKRLGHDSGWIDGTGVDPVRFDLRAASILLRAGVAPDGA